jgi:hypothetical protein
MTLITDNAETLMRQAWKTASEYMLHGIDEIDRLLGDGYAKDHPELLGAFIRAAASDFNHMTLARNLGNAIETLARNVEGLGDKIDAFRSAGE